MFATFKSGGKQHRVTAGQTLKVEKLTGEVGSKVVFDDVLVAGGKVTALDKAKVEAEILEQAKDKKVIVFKKKRRHNYRRKQGHRQFFTKLRILSVTGADGKAVKAEAPKKVEEAKKAAPKAAAKETATKKAPAKKTAAAKKEEK